MIPTLVLTMGLVAPQADPASVSADPALKPIPELRAAMAANPADKVYRAYAVLDERMTLLDFRGEVDALPRGVRQQHVAQRLQAFAEPRQAELIALLESLEPSGDVERIRPLWITNTVVFHGTAAAIDAVSQLEDVVYVGWDPVRDTSFYQDVVCPGPVIAAPPGIVTPEPNLVNLQAPDLWQMGIIGSGAIILNIDSGVDKNHPDLIDRIWANPADPIDGVDNDGNGYTDDYWGWDFVSNDNEPGPSGSHGTNTAGIMVGDASAGQFRTGMAPGASMAAAYISGETDHWEAQQWGISVGIDCSSSSHSYKWNFSPKPDYHMHRSVEDMVLAAGIIHANSIGNQGGSLNPAPPFQISAPGISPSPWLHTDQIQPRAGTSGVMACGGILLPNDAYYTSSSTGPSAWEDIDPLYTGSFQWPQDPDNWDYPVGGWTLPTQGLLKPDVCTYTNVVTTGNGTSYNPSFGGTSAATPHLGGAMALMVSAQPKAPPRHISQVLQITAVDLGAPGKDNLHGSGKIQVKDAAHRLFHGVISSNIEPSPGDPLTFSQYGFPNDGYWTVYAFQLGSTSTPFGNFEVAEAQLLTSGFLDANGDASMNIVLPAEPSISGLDIYLQSLEDNTGGLTGQFLFSPVERISVQ